MSTTKKGDILENNALGIIERLIEEKRLGILKECIKVYSKKEKKYPSKLIGRGNVEFDLTIEVWALEAPKYSMIYIIECKNYKHRVPIGQIKKFHSDILETQGVNAKGILITNSPLQKGALEYADVNDIMVIEGETKDNYKITLYKSTKEKTNSIPKLNELVNLNIIDEGIKSLEKLIDTQILNSLIISDKEVSYGLDKLSKKDIKQIAESELNEINTHLLENAKSLNKETLINYLKSKYNIKVKYFTPDNKEYLGTCEIDKLEIGISKRIADSPREMFVLAHEFGHFILHQKLRINQQILDSFKDSEFNIDSRKHNLKNTKNWIEWQANYFSASLLLPETSITVRLWKSMQRRDLTKGDYILNDSDKSHRTLYGIIDYLSSYFNVSKSSIIYRLNEFELVKERSQIRSIKELLEDLIQDFKV